MTQLDELIAIRKELTKIRKLLQLQVKWRSQDRHGHLHDPKVTDVKP